jgi:hypothetical protein
MKTIAINDLIAQINANASNIETCIDYVDSIQVSDYSTDENGDECLVKYDKEIGYITRTLDVDDVTVTLIYDFEHKSNKASQVTITNPDGQFPLYVTEAEIVDEDGDEVATSYLERELRNSALAYDEGDWHEEDEIEYVCAVKEGSDSVIIVKRDNDADLKFEGDEISIASTNPDQSHYHFSGSVGRYRVLRLYKTKNNLYVCQKIDRTHWQGERDRHSGAVCETIEQVKDFFGFSALAKQLYDDASIDASIYVS